MKANFHSILCHDSFYHGCQVINYCMVVMSNLLYYLISIFVSIYHNYTLFDNSWDLWGNSGYFDPRLFDFHYMVHPIWLWILVNSHVIL